MESTDLHPRARTTALERESTRGLMVTYAAIRLCLVVGLGLAILLVVHHDARASATASAVAEARLLATTEVAPVLEGAATSAALPVAQRTQLAAVAAGPIGTHQLDAVSLTDLSGRTVFATGATAPGDVTVSVPVIGGSPATTLGHLTVGLPPGALSAVSSAGVSNLDEDLILGLGALFLALLAISLAVNAGFHRQIRARTYLAEHDPLTALPNRSMFQRRAARSIADGAGTDTAVAIIDLDRFKVINDTLGHDVGDELLEVIAARLHNQLRIDDVVARLGGDEFGLVLRDCEEPERALWRVRQTIEGEIRIKDLPLSVDASIGYVMAGGAGTDLLLQRAEIAMYEAKARHAGVLRYDASQDHYDVQNLSLSSELRNAIDDDQLVLHYQPKARLTDGAVEAMEALVRWEHPRLGLLAPDRFVPLAEQSDLIDRLTEWVLRRALRDIGSLGPKRSALSVAVNVSARNLGRPGLPSLVRAELDRAWFAPERLTVEMTETALLSDPLAATGVLDELRAMGVGVSLDDFGSGQTSLGYVSNLPISELKIDRTFVAGLTTRPADAAIVRSMVDLGHNLDLRVVAEGIETAETWAAVADSGCDLAQGFFLARPMALEALSPWLDAHPAALTAAQR